MSEDNAQAADDTRKLRARFPRWGILFDPLEVEAAARGETGPDEGKQTQTWRAHRGQALTASTWHAPGADA